MFELRRTGILSVICFEQKTVDELDAALMLQVLRGGDVTEV